MCTTGVYHVKSCSDDQIIKRVRRRLTRIFLVLWFGKVSTAFCWDELIHFSYWMCEFPVASCPRHRTWREFLDSGSPSWRTLSLPFALSVLKLHLCPLAWHSGESSLKAPEISDASVPQGLLVEVLWGLNAENEKIQLLMTHAGRFLTLLNSKWILFCWLHTFLLSQPSLSFPFLSSSHQHLSSFVSSLQSSSSPLSCSSVSPLPLYP